MEKNVVAVIQARMGSERLPGKTLLKLGSSTILEHVFRRAAQSKHAAGVVVATSVSKEDDDIAALCDRKRISCYRGSENNVLERFCEAAELFDAAHVVRVCADSPFLDAGLMDRIICSHLQKKADFSHVLLNHNVLFGVASCVFTRDALRSVYNNARSRFDKEHVNTYVFAHPEKYKINPVAPYKYMLRPYRVTLDTQEDYLVIKKVYEGLRRLKKPVSARNIVNYLDKHPGIAGINSHVKQKYM